MIKVLFLIHDLGQGGAEKVLVNLVNNMDRSKFDITVVTLFGGGVNEQFLKPHIKLRSVFKKAFLANSKIMKLFTPKFLHKYCIKEHCDIEVSYLEGPSARIISGCPYDDTKLISWIHVQQETKERLSSSFKNFEEAKKCYERFDNTVCVSEYVKKDFTNILEFNGPVEVLYNTNETEQIIEKANECIDNYVFNKDVPTIVAMGTLKKSKGFDKLIKVHKRLLDNDVQHEIIVLGIGPEENNLRDLINKNKVDNTFKLLGYDTNPYKYLRNSDLFVCSSIAEGFSTAATEALIVGTPVVTVEVSGMKEMLGENNEYGIVTENNEEALYEGIKKMFTTPGMLEDYTARAQERGKYFSTENTVKAVENMFIDVLI